MLDIIDIKNIKMVSPLCVSVQVLNTNETKTYTMSKHFENYVYKTILRMRKTTFDDLYSNYIEYWNIITTSCFSAIDEIEEKSCLVCDNILVDIIVNKEDKEKINALIEKIKKIDGEKKQYMLYSPDNFTFSIERDNVVWAINMNFSKDRYSSYTVTKQDCAYVSISENWTFNSFEEFKDMMSICEQAESQLNMAEQQIANIVQTNEWELYDLSMLVKFLKDNKIKMRLAKDGTILELEGLEEIHYGDIIKAINQMIENWGFTIKSLATASDSFLELSRASAYRFFGELIEKKKVTYDKLKDYI